MGFANIAELVDAVNGGSHQISSFRKNYGQATTAGVWFDLSMSPGNPVNNFYASSPLEAAVLNGREGIYHGENVSPATKHLFKTLIRANSATPLPLSVYMLDYLIYYPFVDMDSTDVQSFDNTVTLPRYSNGDGVMAFLVAQGTYVGGQSFSISYTNQSGVSGRTSPLVTSNVATSTGSLIGSGPSALNFGPFIPLQSGDTGIRSVESITFSASNGGIAALVLCKPLAQTLIRELTAPVEKEYSNDAGLYPRIQDGAYINFIAMPNGSMSGVSIEGIAEFAWK